MSKEITITRKLEFYPIGESASEFNEWLRNDAYVSRKAKQLTYNYMMEREIIIDRVKQVDQVYQSELENLFCRINTIEEKLKSEDINKSENSKYKKSHNAALKKIESLRKIKSSESYNLLLSALGYAEKTEVSKAIQNTRDSDGVKLKDKINYTEHLSSAIGEGLAKFKSDKDDLKKGLANSVNYKIDNSIIVRCDNTEKRELNRFRKEGVRYYAKLSKFDICFNLGSHPSKAGMAKQTLDGIINKEFLKRCDSQVIFEKKNGKYKYYLLMVLKQEITLPKLDPTRIMGVDMGMDIPAYTAMEYNPEKKAYFGAKRELLDFKTRIQELKRLEKKRQSFGRGGHGRKRKMRNSRLEAIREREANFSKTYNHVLSKQIVNYALKNKVGKIRLEKIESEGLSSNVLGKWTYFDLQQKIKSKAEKYGMEVEMINPAYTSKTCSGCGFVKDDFKLGNRDGESGREFHCPKCGLQLNSDHNAAINISRGGVPGKSKKE